MLILTTNMFFIYLFTFLTFFDIKNNHFLTFCCFNKTMNSDTSSQSIGILKRMQLWIKGFILGLYSVISLESNDQFYYHPRGDSQDFIDDLQNNDQWAHIFQSQSVRESTFNNEKVIYTNINNMYLPQNNGKSHWFNLLMIIMVILTILGIIFYI